MRLVGRTSTRVLVTGLTLVAMATLATGCRAEPSATPSATPTSTVKEPTPGPSVSPIETDLPQSFELPGACEDIYSAGMLAHLQEAGPPLNDPGVTMLSTENVDILEILDGGAPTLRCTWGQPSEFGLATNVTAIDAEQSETVAAALAAAGFGCEDHGDGTICRIEQRGVTLDDEEYTRGETHYIGGGGLVTTAWINFSPDGYTEDIVATLWG
jgi:hypothetical protein